MSMPDKQASDSSDAAERTHLLEAVATAGREMNAQSLMVHEAMAALRGLTAVEAKALDVLDEGGPVSAGQLAERLRLKPATISGLVDRLERKRFVHRVQDPDDRRRVLIDVVADRRKGLESILAAYVASIYEIYGMYTDDELRVLLRFMRQMIAVQAQNAERLSGSVN